MIGTVLKMVIGSKNERDLKKLQPLVVSINDLEAQVSKLKDHQLQAKTPEFKERIERGEPLDEILPEAFAVVRETSRRVLGERHFDAQLIGGIVLHKGKIAEMKTGEGKTLASTLPAYINALKGKGVHIVTVNDYLAKRDSEWMGTIYRFLGLSVGVIVHDMDDESRRKSYNSDITYGTNNEFGFDYLRDNMKFSLDDYVQRKLHYAIVDEVDSILIDEARTPLIISGPTEESTDKYYQINRIIPRLKNEKDYTIEEKTRTVALTEKGVDEVEKLLHIENLYDPRNIEILHHVNQGLKAHTLFKKDIDYVVKDNQVVIVDEFTGRLMPGRRYSDGLHQALEAKENVKIENENQTLASITFQNYFRMYDKLAGMTGTADTEAAEFKKIYNLDVMVIPTNMPMIRIDNPDVIYKTEREKFNAAVNEIKELNKIGRPVLVGTISIEKSEQLSKMLKKQGIKHHVLNAKHHQREAEIVAQAGRKHAVTISTNMAGRGTDIILGGNPEFLAAEKVEKDIHSEKYQETLDQMMQICRREKEEVIALGGLHILGTERHESRRIDNQLRGRSGRQGDPGSSKFYLSLEDDLLRIFGAERISTIMDKLGMEEGQPIEHGLVSKAIENAQRKVEGHNFDIRKHLLEYDDVMNRQREVIYKERREVLSSENLKGNIEEITEEVIEEITGVYVDEKSYPDEWDIKGLNEAIYKQFSFRIDTDNITVDSLTREKLIESITSQGREFYNRKEAELGETAMRYLERVIYLQGIDSLWKDHLLAMDHLREGIGLRGYGQKNPLHEYQREGYGMFMDMINRIKEDALEKLYRVQLAREEDFSSLVPTRQQRFFLSRGEDETQTEKQQPVKRGGNKTGRNEPCPCGSGKKYKKCCLQRGQVESV
ncbi:MAG: preprotein translocase subunit SecA [Deltaproteobacteria bacterium CG12_big_fil_rev_8_21_14_0_65_43_10]|nr:MAG: preprotein translocase subunit SecA [Deltaproteobacteria bacterium CG2_30_43_15]PIQ46537.1 MAG: preprotein translocase subunit SecA [Deltaproteobacteria bacterium CG12_big_fil_rev_8_21_14_0_65_43_10]PIU86604.1 MAG: preprotein translocase subunit SecA [Deltaproteobacteria bacterium CG06_land_8_20_14_3_00_44_19]PIX26089.1 MAG: preprotein translocase subunit SecA [Deltaproteobacteria bacterium CG_4_8_14_3_um_filter_43_13]PIZ19865.1 MAG: preprotein translocase subunit SecA [Deltaproteobacte